MLILAAATMFSACNDKSSDSGGSGAPAPSEGGDSSVAASGAAPAVVATQETPEGTLRLFVDAMSRADFAAAANCVDPSSAARGQLEGLSTGMVTAASKADKQVNPAEMIALTFSPPYQNATFEITVNQPPRARASLRLSMGEPLGVDLEQKDGKWFITTGRELLRSAFAGNAAPAAAPAPGAQEPVAPAGGAGVQPPG